MLVSVQCTGPQVSRSAASPSLKSSQSLLFLLSYSLTILLVIYMRFHLDSKNMLYMLLSAPWLTVLTSMLLTCCMYSNIQCIVSDKIFSCHPFLICTFMKNIMPHNILFVAFFFSSSGCPLRVRTYIVFSYSTIKSVWDIWTFHRCGTARESRSLSLSEILVPLYLGDHDSNLELVASYLILHGRANLWLLVSSLLSFFIFQLLILLEDNLATKQ